MLLHVNRTVSSQLEISRQSHAKLDRYVQLAVLPDADEPIGENVKCLACGWGYTDYVGCKCPLFTNIETISQYFSLPLSNSSRHSAMRRSSNSNERAMQRYVLRRGKIINALCLEQWKGRVQRK